MYSPATIANYFIKKHSDDQQLTPMKIIKLVYIAYGWYLALTNGDELVSEEPKAWDLGPVMPSLYNQLKSYGGSKVTDPISLKDKDEEISNSDATFLDFIWNKYGDYNGIELSAITHTKGTPWSEIYPKGSNLVIPKKLIKEHYESKMNETLSA